MGCYTQTQDVLERIVNVRTHTVDTTASRGLFARVGGDKGFHSLFRTTTTIAAVFGLTAFAVSVLAGLSATVAGSTVLMRAMVAMVACYLLGLFVGMVGEHVASDYVKMYKAARPIPAPAAGEVSRGGGAGAAPTSTGGTDVAEAKPVSVV